MRRVGLFMLVAAVSCRANPETTPTSGSSTPEVMVRVTSGPTVRMSSSAMALADFTPDVAPVDSGGECRVMRTSGSGATIVTAYFPNQRDPETVVSLAFDSVGTLVRFTDSRGNIRINIPPGSSPSVRDSLLRSSGDAKRRTSITLDYPLDRAFAVNSGGSEPTQGVTGTIREMESLEKLGPPSARLVRARKLCGV